MVIACDLIPYLLEDELQGILELSIALGAGTLGLPEGRIEIPVHVGDNIVDGAASGSSACNAGDAASVNAATGELGMVESIEGVEPELNANALTHLPCLVEGHIEVNLFGSITSAPRRAPDGPELVSNQREGCRIPDLVALLSCVAGDASTHEARRVYVVPTVARAVNIMNVVA